VLTAFASLVFAYFFFWTIHEDFPPVPSPGPGPLWPVVGGGLVAAAWALTLAARRLNRRDLAAGFYMAMGVATLLSAVGGVTLLAGPYLAAMDPKAHVYQATVWLLLIWSAGHVVLGILMNAYCVARRLAGRMTAEYDIEIANVALYWHFATLTTVVTVAVVAGFPLVAK
jgi:cytochrome c oxidase subunit I+III